MKKVIFTFALGLFLASCGSNNTTEINTSDSTVADSTVVADSAITAVDSSVAEIKAAGDSVAK
jgi:uncharacterized protein YcfL